MPPPPHPKPSASASAATALAESILTSRNAASSAFASRQPLSAMDYADAVILALGRVHREGARRRARPAKQQPQAYAAGVPPSDMQCSATPAPPPQTRQHQQQAPPPPAIVVPLTNAESEESLTGSASASAAGSPTTTTGPEVNLPLLQVAVSSGDLTVSPSGAAAVTWAPSMMPDVAGSPPAAKRSGDGMPALTFEDVVSPTNGAPPSPRTAIAMASAAEVAFITPRRERGPMSQNNSANPGSFPGSMLGRPDTSPATAALETGPTLAMEPTNDMLPSEDDEDESGDDGGAKAAAAGDSPRSDASQSRVFVVDDVDVLGRQPSEQAGGRAGGLEYVTRVEAEVESDTGDATCINGIDLFDELGAGAYGRVMRGISGRYSKPLAVKEIRRKLAEKSTEVTKVQMGDGNFSTMNLVHEANVLRELKHRSIVPIFEVIDDPDHPSVYIVMPLVDGVAAGKTTLASSRADSDDDEAPKSGTILCSKLDNDTLRMLASDVAHGLRYCQRKKIVHGDLKPENIMLELEPAPPGTPQCARKPKCARLVDFGVAITLQGGDWRFPDMPSPAAPVRRGPPPERYNSDVNAFAVSYAADIDGANDSMFDASGFGSPGMPRRSGSDMSQSTPTTTAARRTSPQAGGSAAWTLRSLSRQQQQQQQPPAPVRASLSLADDGSPLHMPRPVPATGPEEDDPAPFDVSQAEDSVMHPDDRSPACSQRTEESPGLVASTASHRQSAAALAGFSASAHNPSWAQSITTSSPPDPPMPPSATSALGMPLLLPQDSSAGRDADEDEEDDRDPHSVSGGSVRRSPRVFSQLLPDRAADHRARGTPAFVAPELIHNDGSAMPHPTPATDAWAFGVTLYGLKYGRLPFSGASLSELQHSILHGAPHFPPPASHEERRWSSLIRALLTKDPRQRLTMSEVCRAAVLKRAAHDPPKTDALHQPTDSSTRRCGDRPPPSPNLAPSGAGLSERQRARLMAATQQNVGATSPLLPRQTP